jgi:hypothetical protein
MMACFQFWCARYSMEVLLSAELHNISTKFERRSHLMSVHNSSGGNNGE